MAAAVEGLTWQVTSPDMFRVAAESMPFLYAGNLTKSKNLFNSYPINTDDRPVIEYQTPKTFRKIAETVKVMGNYVAAETEWQLFLSEWRAAAK